jgi:hypothetical protein
VGEEEEKFCIHAHLLEASSDYFREALSEAWEEQTIRTVRLPDTDADAFKLYAKWLYSRRFYPADEPDTNVREGCPTELHWDEMSACYALKASI